ncbi:hypothetical protein J0J26_20615 [Vibrio vulnificus]|uniref:hypothetical protein n=1 Tax=Vibrio vulnificus TaxID=672 RepID=UPI0019D46F0D|nr:hypothetical protein [Vibrio vulnificus]MBN8090478.1 hypothetical protein [Vibrio vulnificus]MBN8119337.1 hypothetical protein [Vibrio vulnificus]
MNRLEKLHHDLQLTTKSIVVNNVHLSNITGFSRPSISQAIRTGEINKRMHRVLDLVDLVIHAYDITSLWALADPEQGETSVDMKQWIGKKLDKKLSVYPVLEEHQLDLVDVYGRPDIPDYIPEDLRLDAEQLSDDELRQVVKIGEISQQGAIGALKEFVKKSSELNAQDESEAWPKAYFGFTSPLSLTMLREDIQSGHISESYDNLKAKLAEMFGASDAYEFHQVKAALVALECPEMVGKVETTSEEELTGRVDSLISTSVQDAKIDLQCMLSRDPERTKKLASLLLKKIEGKEGQTSRTKMAKAIVSKAERAICGGKNSLELLKQICDAHLTKTLSEQEQRHLIAEKLMQACRQLAIAAIDANDSALVEILGRLVLHHQNPSELCNVRIARWAISDFEEMKPYLLN